MAINKVNYGGQTLIDTSEDTAEAGDVLAGQTFHSKSGLQSTGTLVLPEMVVLSYGHSTWSDFIDAYADNRVVYCRASSGSNPGSGSQTRMAFMAYVNNAESPTEVEFQYYRSVSSHTSSQQGDQVFVYKLNKTNGWSVTTREASVKININANNEGIKTTYSNGVVTTGHSNSVTAQTTQAVYPIAYDAQGHITSSGLAVTIPTNSNIVNGSATGSLRTVTSASEDSSYTIGYHSFTEGYGTKALDFSTHAEGMETTASGEFGSHAEGYRTISSGGYGSHAEGVSTTSSNYGSHAEGFHSTASGGYSHTEGVYTQATGNSSHAEGEYTEAHGINSHSQGYWTIASGRYQTVIGQRNIEDPTAYTKTTDIAIDSSKTYYTFSSTGLYGGRFIKVTSPSVSQIANYYEYTPNNSEQALIIGNGASNTRSNALTVGWSGDVDIASGAHYKINGINLSASDVGAVPVTAGIIQMFAGSTVPAGWLLCDGSAVSRTTYSVLFSVIGTTYGSGDGSTTFNLPDLIGRFAFGADSSSSINLGDTGGEKTVVLSKDDLPEHQHSFYADFTSRSTHYQNSDFIWPGTNMTESVNSYTADGLYQYNAAAYTKTYKIHGETGTGDVSGNAHNNMPPYTTINYIIATGLTS